VALRPTRALVLTLLLGGVGVVCASSYSFESDISPNSEPITPIPAPPPANPLITTLGERLFEDPRLSGGNARSCITCHDIRLNGASGTKRVTAINGSQLRYQPLTVFNAALSFRLSWEGRYRTLEEQALASLLNPKIMASNINDVLGKLRLDRGIVSQFEDAFGHGPDGRSLVEAIATFERSLLTPGSRFDRWLAGDQTALSYQELDGYHQFKSLGCIACHQGVNVGGNLFERRGIFAPLTPSDADTAEFPAFLRVPSLRNVAAMAPYFHDGSAPTLADAVRKMSRAQLNSSPSDAQVQAIVAFLESLTGNYRGRQVGDAE
jgi:cytochrome c peroxidase